MQDTRLTTLIDRGLGQLSRWLRNPWRRISLLLISVLGGNFLATSISTAAGQKADLDVVVAALLVTVAEAISWWVYRSDRPKSLLSDCLNAIKLGMIYGLFVEAFKLGS